MCVRIPHRLLLTYEPSSKSWRSVYFLSEQDQRLFRLRLTVYISPVRLFCPLDLVLYIPFLMCRSIETHQKPCMCFDFYFIFLITWSSLSKSQIVSYMTYLWPAGGTVAIFSSVPCLSSSIKSVVKDIMHQTVFWLCSYGLSSLIPASLSS